MNVEWFLKNKLKGNEVKTCERALVRTRKLFDMCKSKSQSRRLENDKILGNYNMLGEGLALHVRMHYFVDIYNLFLTIKDRETSRIDPWELDLGEWRGIP